MTLWQPSGFRNGANSCSRLGEKYELNYIAMKKETKLVRGQIDRTEFREHSVPLYFTSSYTFDNSDQMAALFSEEEEGYIYSRYSNPNVTEFIGKMADLEGAEDGWATASGMAAVFSTFGALLAQGDHVLSSRSVFGTDRSKRDSTDHHLDKDGLVARRSRTACIRSDCCLSDDRLPSHRNVK